MEKIVTLSCPNCGGKLEVTQDLDRFACVYCGQEHMVQRGAGTVSLRPVVERLDAIQHTSQQILQSAWQGAVATRKVAAELALARIKKERIQATSGFVFSLLLLGVAWTVSFFDKNFSFWLALFCILLALACAAQVVHLLFEEQENMRIIKGK